MALAHRFVARIVSALVVLSTFAAAPCFAERRAEGPKRPEKVASARERAEAQKHFVTARELYRQGNYRGALVELEAARALDPQAKDLVYNIAIVHEKLGELDPAVEAIHVYLAMDLDAAERDRAMVFSRRVEGAKAHAQVEEPKPAPVSAQPSRSSPAPARGRVDAAAIVAASTAVLGLGVGAYFGVRALTGRPSSGFVTGRDGTYAELEDRAKGAHSKAVIADVALGVGVLAAAGAAVLYFGRTRDNSPASALTVVPAQQGAAIAFVRSF